MSTLYFIHISTFDSLKMLFKKKKIRVEPVSGENGRLSGEV